MYLGGGSGWSVSGGVDRDRFVLEGQGACCILISVLAWFPAGNDNVRNRGIVAGGTHLAQLRPCVQGATWPGGDGKATLDDAGTATGQWKLDRVGTAVGGETVVGEGAVVSQETLVGDRTVFGVGRQLVGLGTVVGIGTLVVEGKVVGEGAVVDVGTLDGEGSVREGLAVGPILISALAWFPAGNAKVVNG